MWPYTLSGRLLIDALVGRYPANKLISRGPLLERPKAFISLACARKIVCGISPGFPGLFPTQGQVIHVLLTRLPLYSPAEAGFLVRLACVRRAASVDSEPGIKLSIELSSPDPSQAFTLAGLGSPGRRRFHAPGTARLYRRVSFRLKLGIVYNELHVQPDCQRSSPPKIASQRGWDSGNPKSSPAEIPSAAGLKLVLATSCLPAN